MDQQTAKSSDRCPRREIAAYIDGELAPREELDLEMHFAVCSVCTEELNEQKKLFRALDLVLEDKEDIGLPADFTKVVVTNAESRVSGLRRSKERFNALFICTALFLFAFLGLGSDRETALGVFGKFFEQFLAVGGFIARLIYDIAVGTAVILRSLCLHFVNESALAVFILIVLFGVSALAFSRLAVRYHRI